jgi:hypothetical protein
MALGRNPTSNPPRCEIVQTIDGDWMVLVDGIQWGDGPRDLSGASGQTWPTEREARDAIENENS